jgi:glycosyltransferase involved in cell wall biosynthesis
MGRRPRVLLAAYACSPIRGSEPGLGWNRALETARHCDTWVLCKDWQGGPEIRAHLATHGAVPGLTFVFVGRGPVERALDRVPGLTYLVYNIWQRRAYRAARELHRSIGFDLVHQVTYCGFREPGYLWKLGVPFVWGPLGGTHNFPWRFLPQAGLRGALREGVRSVLNSLQLRFSPRVRAAARRAAVVIVGSRAAEREFGAVHPRQTVLIASNGIATRTSAGEPRANGPLRILWSGRIDPIKALPLLFRVLGAIASSLPFEVHVLGEGPDLGRSRRLARRLGIAERVVWRGWLTHADSMREYRSADVFVFTGLRDSMPTVVLEALASGVPVVCLDHQGVADVITSDCGIKIPVTTPREVEARLGEALVFLARNPSERARLARGAADRAASYSWQHQGNQIARVYEQVLAGTPTHRAVTRSFIPLAVLGQLWWLGEAPCFHL